MIYLQFIVTTTINIQPLIFILRIRGIQYKFITQKFQHNFTLEIHNMNLKLKIIGNVQEFSDLLYVYLCL